MGLWPFGKKNEISDEAFAEQLQAALVTMLGPMDDMVLHALIPFHISDSGMLDQYTFSKCIPGTVVVTQELITPNRKNRPKKGRAGYFELAMCLPPGQDPLEKDAQSLLAPLLNSAARYSYHAAFGPGETAEIPWNEQGDTLAILFDNFNPKGAEFRVGAEIFHLLLIMVIHPTELAFARAEGTGELIERLKKAKAYPYSDLSRRPVA